MPKAKRSIWQIPMAACFGCIAALPMQHAIAAGAFAVDDADVDQPGQCKIESWFSAATNRDRVASVSPACTLNLGRPVEFNPQFTSVRSGGGWTTLIGLLFKTSIFAAETGQPAFALKGGPALDLPTGRYMGAFTSLLATYRISDRIRLNANGGWLHAQDTDAHRFIWGLGFDWKFSENFTLIGEAFGQLGRHDPAQPSFTHPRAQVGLRYTPVEAIDFDVIYGRNITGENAHWITVGLNVRLNALGERTTNTRTTPLYRK